MPTNPHPDDPAEGSPEAIDRQLKRSEEKKGSRRTEKGADGSQRQGKREGGPGSEEAGRD